MSSAPLSAFQSFSGLNVLVTGVTGYLGQLLLAKLLAVSPDVRQVYVVIRARKTATSQQRFDALIQSSLAFELVEKYCKSQGIADWVTWTQSKCTVVTGDIGQVNYAIKTAVREAIVADLNVIIHSAADVSFTNTFHQALNSNFMGTVHSLNLAKQCPQLNAFCYISTAYVSAHQRFTTFAHDAKPVAVPFDVDELAQAAEEDNFQHIRNCEEQMINMKWPNTYVMTKVCAENYVLKNHGSIPVVVIRPSMIASAWKDLSEKGWNMATSSGPTLCTYAIGLGALTIAPVHPDIENSLDLVPSDYVCNVVITALSARLTDDVKLRAQEEAPVSIHYAVLGDYRVSAANVFYPSTVKYFKKHPMSDRMRTPRLKVYSGKSYEKNVSVRYTAPIRAIKALQPILFGPLQKQTGKLLSALQMISKLQTVSRWVVEAEFEFNDTEVGSLFERVVEGEKAMLWNDLHNLDQEEYIGEFCQGVVKLMKAEEAKQKQIKASL